MIKTTLNMKGLTQLAKRLQTLARSEVRVGFFADDVYEDGTPVAQVAAWNEFGSRFHPERPFIQETLSSAGMKRKLASLIKSATQSAIKGNGASRRVMQSLGLYVKEQIQITISSYPGNNSAATIERKGFDRPLFESGKMLESVKFKFGMAGSFE